MLEPYESNWIQLDPTGSNSKTNEIQLEIKKTNMNLNIHLNRNQLEPNMNHVTKNNMNELMMNELMNELTTWIHEYVNTNKVWMLR